MTPKPFGIADRIAMESIAHANHEAARAVGKLFYVAKPGYYALRACEQARFITPSLSLQRQGYKLMTQSEYEAMLDAYGLPRS
jgi:hypothetical protein